MLIGAVAGIVGSLVNRGASYLEKKQEMDAEEKKHAYSLELAKLNASKDIEVQNIKSNSDALAASYQHDSSFGEGSLWVINILRLVRPSITIYALFLITIFWFTIEKDAQEIRTLLVGALIEVTTMTVSWWFADRSSKSARGFK